MADKNDGLSDHDLFMQAIQGTIPLKQGSNIPNTAPKSKQPLKKINDVVFTRKIPLSDHCSIEILSEQYISFVKPGVQPHYFRQLKQGKIPIQAELDLHGYNIDQARDSLLEFIHLAMMRKYRCVRIIHGKGYRGQSKIPLLKSKTYTWLLQLPEILAFSSCQPKDGGTGAVYVLLKFV